MVRKEPKIKSIQWYNGDSSGVGRGKRLQVLRYMTGLIVRELVEKYRIKYKISHSSWKGWEAAMSGGLTQKGALKVLSIMAEEGIDCSPAWLLSGIGPGPQIVSVPSVLQETQLPSFDESIAIANELAFFHEQHPGAVDMIVEDDAMLPRFTVGETVAGIQVKEHFDHCIGQACIIQLGSGERLLRLLQVGTKVGGFTLSSLHAETTVKHPVIYDAQISAIAPVIWARRARSVQVNLPVDVSNLPPPV